MNKRNLLLLLSTLVLGLLILSSCNKTNTLSELEGKTFVPKEELKEKELKLELFFENATDVLVKVDGLDGAVDREIENKEEYEFALKNGLNKLDFRFNYTYDKITREIKLTKTDKTIKDAVAKMKPLIVMGVEKRLKDKEPMAKIFVIEMIMQKIEEDLTKEFEPVFQSIESMIYNEEADEIIIRSKKSNEAVIFKNKA